MRDKLIAKIDEIKAINGNFARDMNQWENAYAYIKDRARKHISEIDYNELDDDELIIFYSRICVRLGQVGMFAVGL